MAHTVMRLNVTASREFHPSLKLSQKTIARSCDFVVGSDKSHFYN